MNLSSLAGRWNDVKHVAFDLDERIAWHQSAPLDSVLWTRAQPVCSGSAPGAGVFLADRLGLRADRLGACCDRLAFVDHRGTPGRVANQVGPAWHSAALMEERGTDQRC